MKGTRGALAVLAAAVIVVGCATQGGAGGGGSETAAADVPTAETASAAAAGTAAPCTWEPWPPPDAAPDVPRPAPSGELVTLPRSPQGTTVLDLLSFVSEKTGAVLFYDEATIQKIKTARVQICGTHIVRERDLFSWLQAVLSFNNLVLVPLGESRDGGAWSVLDANNSLVKVRPVVLRESEVLGYADCDGLYVVTSLRMRDMVDVSRVRQALTAISSTTAGGGRIQDVQGGRAIVVADFAPVVATMKRVVDEINRNAVAAPTAAPLPAKPQEAAPK